MLNVSSSKNSGWSGFSILSVHRLRDLHVEILAFPYHLASSKHAKGCMERTDVLALTTKCRIGVLSDLQVPGQDILNEWNGPLTAA
jgi:hypothetical protein